MKKISVLLVSFCFVGLLASLTFGAPTDDQTIDKINYRLPTVISKFNAQDPASLANFVKFYKTSMESLNKIANKKLGTKIAKTKEDLNDALKIAQIMRIDAINKQFAKKADVSADKKNSAWLADIVSLYNECMKEANGSSFDPAITPANLIANFKEDLNKTLKEAQSMRIDAINKQFAKKADDFKNGLINLSDINGFISASLEELNNGNFDPAITSNSVQNQVAGLKAELEKASKEINKQ